MNDAVIVTGSPQTHGFSKYLLPRSSSDRALIDEGTEALASFDEANQ